MNLANSKFSDRGIKSLKLEYRLVNCKECGEDMVPRTIVWKETNRPPVQHTNFTCEICGNSEYRRYVMKE